LLAAAVFVPPPGELSPAAWRTAMLGLMMAALWVTELVPVAATALLPIALFPALGVADLSATTSPYADPMVFLFLGGFVIALAMERCGLHRRIALHVVAVVGRRGRRAVVAGFLVATAFLSMWVSNTATALMMLPIAVSVGEVLGAGEGEPDAAAAGGTARGGFLAALMLAIAYGANIGGMGTLVGTPPNALMAAYLEQTHGIEVGFAGWMLIGVPVVLAGLPISYFVLTRLAFWVPAGGAGAGAAVRRELQKLGPVSRAEATVAVVFVATALAWVSRPLLEGWAPGLSDTGIAVAAAFLLFLLPVGGGDFAMDWEWARRLPWGVLLLFGGGLSLAAAVKSTGLAGSIGGAAARLAGVPEVAMVAVLVVVMLAVTELASNTATTAAFLPVVGAVAAGAGYPAGALVAPVTLAASGAFMLPVGTPTNAVVFGSDRLTMGQMVRAGVWLNLGFALLLPLVVPPLWRLAFGGQ
jgi:sodium-dependent dicarboxylate transporter 2/3/5